MKRCSRQKWLAKAHQAKADAILTSPRSLSANVRDGAAVLTNALQDVKKSQRSTFPNTSQTLPSTLHGAAGASRSPRQPRMSFKVRAGVWPETAQAAGLDLEVKLDDSGKVEAMHARLAMLLGLPPLKRISPGVF